MASPTPPTGTNYRIRLRRIGLYLSLGLALAIAVQAVLISLLGGVGFLVSDYVMITLISAICGCNYMRVRYATVRPRDDESQEAPLLGTEIHPEEVVLPSSNTGGGDEEFAKPAGTDTVVPNAVDRTAQAEEELLVPRQRLHFLDNVKIFLTFIVLEHHVACAFGACGENWTLMVGDYSNSFQDVLKVFTMLNQAYFMSLFFFISAYFVPSSYNKRGSDAFFAKLSSRIYLPAMVATFTIIPASNIIGQVVAGIDIFYIPVPGHCWFLLWLLFFNWIYSLVREATKSTDGERRLHENSIPFPGFWKRFRYGFFWCGLLMLVVIVVVPGRFWTMPVSFGSIICDIIFFSAGTCAAENQWLVPAIREKLECSMWLFRGTVLLEMGVMVLLSIAANEVESVGILLVAVAGVYCIDMSIAILEFFQTYANVRNKFSTYLVDAAYTVYLIHPLVVTAATAIFVKMYNALFEDDPIVFEDGRAVSKSMLQGPGDGALHLFVGFVMLSLACNVICWPLAWWIQKLRVFGGVL